MYSLRKTLLHSLINKTKAIQVEKNVSNYIKRGVANNWSPQGPGVILWEGNI